MDKQSRVSQGSSHKSAFCSEVPSVVVTLRWEYLHTYNEIPWRWNPSLLEKSMPYAQSEGDVIEYIPLILCEIKFCGMEFFCLWPFKKISDLGNQKCSSFMCCCRNAGRDTVLCGLLFGFISFCFPTPCVFSYSSFQTLSPRHLPAQMAEAAKPWNPAPILLGTSWPLATFPSSLFSNKTSLRQSSTFPRAPNLQSVASQPWTDRPSFC